MIRTLSAMVFACGVALWGAPALAVDPLTGPNYDRLMALDIELEPMGFSVGYFAACAQDRMMSIVAGGVRPPPGRRVRGEELDGEFVVSVPGTTDDILFHFVPSEDADDTLVLDRIAIGSMIARRAADKERAVRALVPNCI